MINETINNNNEVTFYRFLSEMKGFLGRLLKSPIDAQPSEFLKRNGFSKTRIINVLMKKGVLERNEKILTPDKTGLDKVQYAVTYKVKRKDFERTLKRMYSRYFEKNLPEKEETSQKSFLQKSKPITECDGSALGGATSAANSGQYTQPLGDVQRRKTVYFTEKQINELKNKLSNMGKKVIFTEEQWKQIMECNGIDPQILDEELGGATTCASVGSTTTRGDVGYDAPAFDPKKGDKFWKSSMTHNKKGGVSCDRLDKNGKAPE